MSAESAIYTRQEAEQVRRRVGEIGREALEKLGLELSAYTCLIVGKGKRKRCSKPIPEAWTRKYKAVADQLRRDYRLDEAVPDTLPDQADQFADEPAAAGLPADADPFGGLKILSGTEAA